MFLLYIDDLFFHALDDRLKSRVSVFGLQVDDIFFIVELKYY